MELFLRIVGNSKIDFKVALRSFFEYLYLAFNNP